MDLDIPNLAKLHFITEQTARHARLQQGQEPAPWPYPDFEAEWQPLNQTMRGWYLRRVEQLAATDLQPRPDFDYEGILKLVYAKCYADMEEGTAREISSVGLSDFRSHLCGLSGAEWAALYNFPFVEEEEVDDDAEDEGDMPDVEEEPLDYDPRGEEDPQLSRLEKSVEAGMATLERLRKEIERLEVSMDDTNWISEIAQIEPLSERGQVVIALVEGTGVGKSSLINALIDEEKMLPTDCMRASTAVPTEISYNYGESQYRAEIKFVDRHEWEKELRALLMDLDEKTTGEIGENIASKSEAGIALAKIKAVYPWLETREIMATPVEILLNHPNVSGLLGSERVVEENKRQTFHRKVRIYLDSKGKSRVSIKKAQPYSNMSLWPLIRVVRIFVKAPALATGAVSVDLPGIFDSNAARVAVAEQYMKRCSAHWVIAPIKRAVDDKVAKDLLGKNFKMKLHMDSAFSSITFVCTMTDEISITDTQDSLKLNLPVPEQREAMLAQLQIEWKELFEKREQIIDDLADIDEEIDGVEAQLNTAEHPPKASILIPAKRKRQDDLIGPETSAEVPMDPNIAASPSDIDDSKPSVTDHLVEKLQDLKAQRKDLVAQRRPMGQEIKIKENEIKEFEAKSHNMKVGIHRTCIEARNGFSKKEIKRDFARGIQELDEGSSEGYDETTGQGIEGRRTQDYQELETDLPVFCVSARAYQKLRGRMRKEATAEGFTKLEETEILQLQRHCITLTEEARKDLAQYFLAHLQRLLHSMSLWSSLTNPATVTISENRKGEMHADYEKTRQAFNSAAKELWSEFLANLEERFYKDIVHKLDHASEVITEELSRTVTGWHGPKNQGGIYWSTYRATCSRDGVYRTMNWNEDFAHPLWKAIHHGWIKTFEYFIRWEFETLAQVLQEALGKFHLAAIRSAKHELPNDHMEMLAEALDQHCQLLASELKAMKRKFKAAQKQISFIFPNTIREEMAPTYEACARETGRGTSQRMKDLMTQKVVDNAGEIIEECTKRVKRELERLKKDTANNLDRLVHKTLASMQHVYYIALIEPQVRQFTANQIEVRRQLNGIVREMISDLQLGQLLKQK
ncbi:uncharacterized protein LDX57_000503 [Aspergillus melleus]|uniref:uncharacterized protein n=1 Tax=Aspergillus melleus TaxID=138277 RepID=UPI001E8E703C|nr:uncharacterized protein LDX57_000503 [Aspergillus melleus]KAH8422747.1 hypothetical protein LDX57_000503 [Aspergillus melleus]